MIKDEFEKEIKKILNQRLQFVYRTCFVSIEIESNRAFIITFEELQKISEFTKCKDIEIFKYPEGHLHITLYHFSLI